MLQESPWIVVRADNGHREEFPDHETAREYQRRLWNTCEVVSSCYQEGE